MALRGKKPEQVTKRLKAFFYGPAGCGKTYTAIHFPKPYLIDTERGAENSQYKEILEKQDGVIYQTTDFSELLSEVKALLTENHSYKTLIIDPLTTIYNDLVDKSGQKNGTDFGRHYMEANKHMKQLYNLLLRLDMNVIITSHAKAEYSNDSKMTVIGNTFDCYKKLDYLFDLVFEIQPQAGKNMARVKKTRIEEFKLYESINFTYEEIAGRYGFELIEKDAMPEILATSEQVMEFNNLIENIKLPEDTIEKWLDKAKAETIHDMNTETIQKCIEFMKDKIKLKGE